MVQKLRSLALTMALTVVGLTLVVPAASAGGSAAPPTGHQSVSGGPWTLETVPSVSTVSAETLSAVSCSDAQFCVAVGSDASNAAIDQWDGTAWSNVTGLGAGSLNGVSCVTNAVPCVAVGQDGAGTLAEVWNSSVWSATSGVSTGSLAGVSCVGPSWCVAVGANAGQTLIQQWSGGTWSVVTSPNSAMPNNFLTSVSCPTSMSCVGVGFSADALFSTFVPLTETWNGSSWSIVPAASSLSTRQALISVSCASPSFCVSVGDDSSGAFEQTLAEWWNGSMWTIAPTADATTSSNNELDAVSCVSTTFCNAVGRFDDSPSTTQPLAEHFNGINWILDATPASGMNSSLGGISCYVAFTCTAVGVAISNVNQPIAMYFALAGSGYRLVAADGGVFTFGGAPFEGSTGGKPLNKPIVGMAATPSGNGYYLLASDGGVFSFGDAPFEGSMGGKPLNKPIVGGATSPSGNGYYLLASDGGVFSFGDAPFEGSMGGKPLNKPIVGMATTPSGQGYWMVASDGGVFSFGDAPFEGSMGGKPLNKPIVGMAASPSGHGYWMVASDGGVFSFGDAPFEGSTGGKPLNKPIVGMAASPSGNGYYMLASDGGVFSFGDAPFAGSAAGSPLVAPIVGGSGVAPVTMSSR